MYRTRYRLQPTHRGGELVLFRRKNRNEHRSTRDLDQGPSETTQVLNTHTESPGHGNPMRRSLDDIGSPPPPPLDSSSSGEYNPDAHDDYNLVPYNDHVHETSEAELPEDYERKIVYGDDGYFGYGPAGEFVGRGRGRRDDGILSAPSDRTRGRGTQKSNKNADRNIEKMDERIRKIREETKEEMRALKNSVKSDMKEFKDMTRELRKELKRTEKTNEHYKKANEDLLKENKDLKRELKRLQDTNDRFEKVEERNERFIDDVRRELAPYKRQEEEMTKHFKAQSERLERTKTRFDELLRYSKTINSRNDSFRKEFDKVWNTISRIEGRLDEHSREVSKADRSATKASDDLQEVAARVRKLDDRLGTVEKADFTKMIRDIKDRMSAISDENKRMNKDIGKVEHKFEILRDKIEMVKKSKRS